MLRSAVVVPAAPVLVPQVSQGAAPELNDCRTAALAALDEALGHGAEVADAADPVQRVVVVGPGTSTRRHPPGAHGSFRPLGVDLDIAAADDGPRSEPLPLSLSIGAWMLGQVGWAGHTVALEVAETESPAVCARLGSELAGEPGRTVMLVMADGTARRGPSAPGYTDARSAGYDAVWIDAVGAVDTVALAGLDDALAQDLMMAGRAPLQVLAGAASTNAGVWQADTRWTGDPYGVAYAVATWRRMDG